MKAWEKTLEGLSKISNVAFQCLVTGFVVLAVTALILLPFVTMELVLAAVIVNGAILSAVVSLGCAADALLVRIDVARIKEEQRRKAASSTSCTSTSGRVEVRAQRNSF